MEKIITIINRVGTKKHQLNGVEYTSTAIGIELIGRCRHLPPPILIFLHCNTPIYNISQIHSESLYKNNSSIVWMKMAYPSHHSYNDYNPKHHIHHIWNCPQPNHTMDKNTTIMIVSWIENLYLFFNILFPFL